MKRAIGLVAAAMAIAAGTTVAGAQEPRRGGTLVMGTGAAISNFNNAVASGAGVMVPGAQVFASPLMHDENWKP